MSGWQMISVDGVKTVPWRNGGGLTRELLAWPDIEKWRVRVSVADIERDGHFSSFPGVRRHFAVLSGQGVRIRVDGVAHEVFESSQPFAFDGHARTHCELLDGPTRDFNLMLVGSHGHIERVAGIFEAHGRAGKLALVYAVKGAATVSHAGESQRVPAHTLAWRILASDGPLRLVSDDALWMEIDP
jgi:environmental stress-induced protein Ves